jgi:hypothetical protein
MSRAVVLRLVLMAQPLRRAVLAVMPIPAKVGAVEVVVARLSRPRPEAVMAELVALAVVGEAAAASARTPALAAMVVRAGWVTASSTHGDELWQMKASGMQS